MRRFLVVSLIAAFSLSAGSSQAQVRKDPEAKPDPLEELQAEALKNNPDIKVAEAELRLAEARFERVRAHFKAKIAVAYAEVEAARAGFAEGAERYKRAEKLFALKAISGEDLNAARLTMAKLQKELAVKEAELQVLVGPPALKKAAPVKPGAQEKNP